MELPDCGEAPLQVSQDVVNVLCTHRQTDGVGPDPLVLQLLRGQLAVGGGGRVDHQALDVSHVGQQGKDLKAVNEAVDNMTDCMKETTEFLEKSVLEDYKEFQEVSVQYQADADAYGDNMNKVKDAIDKLTALTETSAEALDGIKDTVNESATGVTDIAQKTSDMVEKTVDIHDKVTECYGCADELNNIVAKFKLK